MADFKNRVLTLFLFGIMLVFTLLALIVGNIIHHNVKENRISTYEKNLNLIAYVLRVDSGSIAVKGLLEQTADDLGVTVSILNPKGETVETSSKSEEAERFPVQVLKNKLSGTSIYGSTISGKDYYTIPVRETRAGGYVQLSVKAGADEDAERSLWLMMAAGFLVCFMIILIVSVKIIQRIVRPVDEATFTAKELARGNFKVRTYEYRGEDIGELNYSLNVLARNLEKMTKSHESQQDRLKTLIENMGSGLILIDSNGYINLVNRAFKEYFKEHADSWTGHLFYEVFPHAVIKEVVKETYLTEKNVRRNVLLPIHIERKHFSVDSVPILDVNGKLRGIVLVFHDITELKKLEQMRKDFVANVSHELKTPITSLKGFAETLLDGAGENPEYRRKFLSIILNESERLQSLIQDLLDLSKTEQGFNLDWQKLELSQLVQETMEMLEKKARDKDIQLSLDISGSTLMDGDAPRLKQIIINLISNSLTYTPAGGNVSIKVEEDKKNVLLSVTDTGIGISKEEIPRIFERFYRVDKARSRNSGGTGLGLAIVKHLVEAHHGTINVKSKVGKGSEFTIRFKKKQEEV
ncbi:two-component system histidine kinase PnpS [Fictibacillus aquaticus]|uniref:histidine kinase n=1 Tax=Fictibacillus aquaticus TaxID=2021314 RepID=A0A235FA76_9BACL|nr:HAMP domain-containing sensor histidine kinase [Fictibacillus aquaticus]OYD58172.1 PAS domain-containing sensor histidine kinase [Fictibacillus aquaticus]